MVFNRYLYEFVIFVLYLIFNYGFFNFIVMDNGGGDVENYRFSSIYFENSGGK